jgi:carbon monoxide dehydrogenase subunit G
MQLEHSFDVPGPVEDAWSVLLDVERIAPCMPGAVLEEVTDDSFTGTVKVKVGPITVTYAGTARFVSQDAAAHVVVIDARGKETRGTGTAAATVTSRLRQVGAATRCDVSTDLAITGKPAQFGRGVMADVGRKLIGQFAGCLAEEIVQPHSGPVEPAPLPAATPPEEVAAPAESALPPDAEPTPAPAPPATPRKVTQHRQAAPIDLIRTAGGPVLKRMVGPAAGALALLLLIRWLWRHLDDD